MRRCIIWSSFVLLCGLSQAGHGQKAQPVSPGPGGRDNIVAIVGAGRVITEREIDASIGPEVYALQQRIYALRKNAVENLINRFLLEKEAAANGITVEELKKLLVSEKTEISDADVDRAYSENGIAVAATHGTHTVEETKKIIRRQLEDRAGSERYNAALAELRKQAKVDIFLEEPQPPPVTVSDAGPSRGSKNALLTIVEFADFQCPTCKSGSGASAR